MGIAMDLPPVVGAGIAAGAVNDEAIDKGPTSSKRARVRNESHPVI